MQDSTQDFFGAIETFETVDLDDLFNPPPAEPEEPSIQLESNPETYVYVIACPELNIVKIGFSASPDERLSNLRACFPCDLRHVAVWAGTRTDEKCVHHELKLHRKRGEWFRLSEDDAVRQINRILDRRPLWRAETQYFKREEIERIQVEREAEREAHHAESLSVYAQHFEAFTGQMLTVTGSESNKVLFSATYRAYIAWCEDRDMTPLKMSEFRREMAELGVTRAKANGQIYFFGLTLRLGPG